MTAPADTGQWWHAYGGVQSSGPYEGCWLLLIPGPTDQHPDALLDNGRRVRDPLPDMDGQYPDLPYLTSFDHEPTDEEKQALEPPDEDDDDTQDPRPE